MNTVLYNIWQRNKIRYFTIEEVTMGRLIPHDLLSNIEYTIAFLDKMRCHLGFPISITSSYRNEALNALIGGVKNSLHLMFNALDSVPSSGDREQLKAMQKYTSKWRTRQMGVGYYETFLHTDNRGFLNRYSPVTWGKVIDG